jgi:hypothetical protein
VLVAHYVTLGNVVIVDPRAKTLHHSGTCGEGCFWRICHLLGAVVGLRCRQSCRQRVITVGLTMAARVTALCEDPVMR